MAHPERHRQERKQVEDEGLGFNWRFSTDRRPRPFHIRSYHWFEWKVEHRWRHRSLGYSGLLVFLILLL